MRPETAETPQVLKKSVYDALNEDTIQLVIREVFENSPADLLNLCLVCRGFYVSCIPWIYHEVTIDFSKQIHLHLLRRLARNFGSKLPTHIRGLNIEKPEDANSKQLSDLSLLLTRLTKLEEIRWCGHVEVPKFLLDALSTKFSNACLNVQVSDEWQQQGPNGAAPPSRLNKILSHDASSQITSLRYTHEHPVRLYPGFKNDLVNLLTSTPALWDLEIVVTEDLGMNIYPDMDHIFQRYQFPNLACLRLSSHARIFTTRELEIWGDNMGGWPRLTALQLYWAADCRAFIGRVPNLLCLNVAPQANSDFSLLKEALEKLDPATEPFGKLTALTYSNIFDLSHLPAARTPVPWCILQKTCRSLTTLHLIHLFWNNKRQALFPQVIRMIRKQCPNLRTFGFAVQVDNGWPLEILTEAALVKNLEGLVLYVHISRGKSPAFYAKRNFRQVFDFILEVRTTNHLTSNELDVSFKPASMTTTTCNPPISHHNFRKICDGSIIYWGQSQVEEKESLQQSSTDKLKKAYQSANIAMAKHPIPWSKSFKKILEVKRAIASELESRKRYEQMNKTYQGDGILFDKISEFKGYDRHVGKD